MYFGKNKYRKYYIYRGGSFDGQIKKRYENMKEDLKEGVKKTAYVMKIQLKI